MVGRVFWALILGFLLGVFLASIFNVTLMLAIFCVILSIACIGAAFLMHERKTGILLGVLFLCCALGIIRMDFARFPGDSLLFARSGDQITIVGTIVGEPDQRESSVRLHVDVDSVVENGTPLTVRGGVLIVAPPHRDVSYGDRVTANGLLRTPQSFDTGEGRQFDYPSFLAAQGIKYELARATIEEREEKIGNPIVAFAIGLKQSFLKGLADALPEPVAGLAGGITVGDKRSIGEELTADFQTVGLVHIIVLSGYNMTIVLNAFGWLLARTPLLAHRRFAQLGLNGVIVTLFVLMTGGASSAARAGVMALIAVYARGSRRVFLASRALAIAALSIVLWNPFVLAFDPGFQLSILATVGLIVFTPLFSDRLQWIPEKWALREIVSSTLGTQLAVLPLLLYQNGHIPLYALPANLLALICIPFAMLFSLIAGVAGMLFDSFAVPFGLPAYILLEYVITIAQLIAHVPFADISIPAFSPLWLVPLYAFLFMAAKVLWGKRAEATE